MTATGRRAGPAGRPTGAQRRRLGGADVDKLKD